MLPVLGGISPAASVPGLATQGVRGLLGGRTAPGLLGAAGATGGQSVCDCSWPSPLLFYVEGSGRENNQSRVCRLVIQTCDSALNAEIAPAILLPIECGHDAQGASPCELVWAGSLLLLSPQGHTLPSAEGRPLSAFSSSLPFCRVPYPHPKPHTPHTACALPARLSCLWAWFLLQSSALTPCPAAAFQHLLRHACGSRSVFSLRHPCPVLYCEPVHRAGDSPEAPDPGLARCELSRLTAHSRCRARALSLVGGLDVTLSLSHHPALF